MKPNIPRGEPAIKGIWSHHIHKVRDGGHLYTSEKLDERHLPELHKEGITWIFAVHPNEPVLAKWRQMGKRHAVLELNTDGHSEVNMRAEEAAKALRSKENVLICCDQGVHRSPVFAYWVLRKLNFNHEDAVSEIKKHSFISPVLDFEVERVNSLGLEHGYWK